MSRLTLELIGSPTLSIDGEPVRDLSRQDAALLALLAIEGAVDRARAGGLLWPDSDARRANNSLRQRIFRLKRAAGCDLVRGDRVLTLDPAIQHDIGRLAAGLPSDMAPPEGDLLGAIDYSREGALGDWVGAARENWRCTRRDLVAGQIARLEADGRLAAALRLAERLVRDEPGAEHAHRSVMRLHYLRGDRAAALTAFDRCKATLLEVIGESPGHETLQLAQVILTSGVVSQDVPSPPPLALLRPPRLVGRELPWRAIESAWRRVQPVLITGDPGVGKSRLIVDFSMAHAGALWAGAQPGDRSVPYATLARLLQPVMERFDPSVEAWVQQQLAHVLPDLGPVTTDSLRPLRLQAAIKRLLDRVCPAGLTALAVDDLQFADDASLELLLPLCASTDRPTLRWLLAARVDEQPAVLVRWLAALQPGQGVQLQLGPLDAAGVDALLQSLAVPGLDAASWAGPMFRHTGGNPMFVLETLLACRSDGLLGNAAPTTPLPVPAQVGLAIDRRLTRISPKALTLAQLAALAGTDFSVSLAAQVLGVPALELATPWRELESAQVLRDSAFAHDLVREACHRSVPEAIAREMHAQIASLAQGLGVPAARVAEHWQRAQAWAPAALQFRLAAVAAQVAGRRGDEARMLDSAARCFQRAGQPAACFEVLCERIGALVQAADAAALDAALRELRGLEVDDDQRAQRAVVEAEAQIVSGQFAQVAQAMPSAIAALQAKGDLDNACLGARRWAVSLVNLGQGAQAIDVLQPWVDRLADLSSLRAQGEFACEFGTVLERANRRQQGAEQLRKGIELAIAAGDPSTAATALVNLGVNRVYWGDLEGAVLATARGLRMRQHDDEGGGLAAGFEMTLGAMCRDVGRYAEGVERLERALASFEADGNALWTVNARSHLALLWLQLGQPAKAQRLLRSTDDGVPPFIQGRQLCVRAQVQSALGLPALPLLDEALAILRVADRVEVRIAIELERSRWLPAAEADRLCRALIDEAERCELMGHTVGARALRVDALLRAGRVGEAAAEADSVVAALPHSAPSGTYRPEAWWICLRAFEAAGMKPQSDAARDQGWAWVDRALQQLPDMFRESFLQRNPVNRQLMLASR